MTAPQLSLDLGPFVDPTYSPEATIQERYEAWRDANPWVLPALARLLDDWTQHGGRRIGVKAAVEWLRWHHARATHGDEWKFNNSFASRMARDLIRQHPHLAECIETRVLRAA